MKKIITLLLLAFSLNTSAQTHVFDFAFGENVYNGVNFTPMDVWLVDGSYYLMNTTQILKLNYNGTIDTTFGTNGIKTNTLPSNFINGSQILKYANHHFYILGYVSTSSTNTDIFIKKLNMDGSPDSTFGVNGTAIIDLGGYERITGFVIDSSNKLLCTGARSISSSASSMIYFRLNENGALDTTLDAQGFKAYQINNSSFGYAIKDYDNGYFLIGTAPKSVTNSSLALYIVKIDQNGTPVTSYGVNGSQTIPFPEGGMSISIQDVQSVGNHLYVKYFYAWSFSTQGTKIMNYDLAQNQIIFNNYSSYTTYLQAVPDGYYTAGINRCVNSPCSDHYRVSKGLVNGTVDTNFNSGNLFVYNFPGHTNNVLSNANVVHADASGKILIAGYTKGYFTGNTFFKDGFSAMRLIPTTLGNHQISAGKISVFPNPFSDKVTISGVKNLKSVELYDITGRLISKPGFGIADGNTTVDMAFVQMGNYLLKIETLDGSISTQKIIKK